MYNLDQEKELVQAAQNGSREAMGRLYDALYPGVYAYARSRLPAQTDAEDCVADVFLKVVRQLQTFRRQQPGSFQAWVFQITRHQIADFYRRRPTALPESVAPPDGPPDGQPDLEEELLHRETKQHLLDHIKSLSRRRQEVILLRYFGGLRNTEIADVLALDERTVASHLSRALNDLQQQLKPEEVRHA